MSDYGKPTDPRADVTEVLITQVPKLIEQHKQGDDLAQNLLDLINGTKADYDDSGAFVPVSEELAAVFSPIRNPYSVSRVFSDMNDSFFRILADGMIVLGGEASAGKTSFMTALAVDLLNNNPSMCALIYSLDDGGLMTKKRIVSQLVGKNVMWESTLSESFISDHDKAVLGRVFVRDSIRLYDIGREAEKVKRLTGCKAVYIGIDYLQIVPVPGDRAGRREGYNDAVKVLKELQKGLAADGCILMLLSQLNRAKKDDPEYESMNRFRETSEVENQADVALLMTPVDAKDEDSQERLIIVLKNKKGARGRKWKTELLKDDGLRYSVLVQQQKGAMASDGISDSINSMTAKRGKVTRDAIRIE